MNDDINSIFQSGMDRRQLLKAGGLLGGGLVSSALLAGCGGSGNSSGVADNDVLNFALNLEYLEAEFYLRATTGQGLSATDAGVGAGAVTGGAQVPFATPLVQQVATEIAQDELNHVRYLRNVLLGNAVARPQIDFAASFPALATAAGLSPTFNPFNDEQSFLLGAFVFEDVGVTAYRGGLQLLGTSINQIAAGGILGTEAYHAGSIRTLIASVGGSGLATQANQIATERSTLDGTTTDDVGVYVNGQFHILDGDQSSLVFSRTTAQVLAIVYAGGTGKGGFFPAGLNGKIH